MSLYYRPTSFRSYPVCPPRFSFAWTYLNRCRACRSSARDEESRQACRLPTYVELSAKVVALYLRRPDKECPALPTLTCGLLLVHKGLLGCPDETRARQPFLTA